MRILKKNQVIIYAFVLMLMVAGYFNYTEKINEEIIETSIETSMQIDGKSDELLADIGDAILVNSNDIVEEQVEEDEEEIEEFEEAIETSSEVTEYFVKSKMERDRMYSEMIATYESVLENPNSSETRETISC